MWEAASLFVLLASRSNGQTPNAATQALLNKNPGLQMMVRNDKLIALYGVPLATDSDPATNTDEFVANFASEQANVDAFGVEGAVLDLANKVTIRNGKYTVYAFVQKIAGLPVHGTIVKIPVLHGATEKISYVGIRLKQPASTPLPQDAVSDTNAVLRVTNLPEYANMTAFTNAEKVLYEDAHGMLHRVWRFDGSARRESYRFFVDTNTGVLVGVEDLVFEAEVSGQVTGFATPCCPPDDPNHPDCCAADNPSNSFSCPEEVQMSGVQVSVVGGGQVYAGQDGVYQFDLPAGQEVTLTSQLIGQWVTVINDAGNDLAPEPAQQTATPPAQGIDFVYNPADANCSPNWPDEFSTAQVNTFLLKVTDSRAWNAVTAYGIRTYGDS